MRPDPIRIRLVTATVGVLAALLFATRGQTQSTEPKPDIKQSSAAAVKQYCATCHAAAVKTAGVVLDPTALAQGGDQLGKNAELWERVIRQLRAKTMPPVGMPRPDQATYTQIASESRN